MKKVYASLVVLSLAIAAPVAVQAQSPFSVEVQAGVVVPTGDFADDFATTGFGFGVHAMYQLTPMIDLYAGYSWQRFGVDEDDFGDVDLDVDDSGFALGARLNLRGMPGFDPWIRGGVILHELKISGSEGGFSASFTSDRSVGFEVAAGLAFPVAPRISIVPSVTFRNYSPEFDGESIDESVSYFGLHVGGRISF
jgi:opacity protein-like surface antigen